MKLVFFASQFFLLTSLAFPQHPPGVFTDIRPVAGLESNARDEGVYVSPDGLTALFNSDRGFNAPYPEYTRYRDLWMATRSTTSTRFNEPVKLAFSASNVTDHSPYLTDDGTTIYFSSGRLADDGSLGSTTWVTQRVTDSTDWSEPVPLVGDVVDLPSERASMPELSQDELTLYFATSSRTGNLDIFFTTRESKTEEFGIPQPIVAANSNFPELSPTVSSDELTLFYWSSQNTDFSFPELFVVSRKSKANPFGNPMPMSEFSRNANFVNAFDPFISRDWPNDGSKLYFSSAPTFDRFQIYEATWRYAPGLCDVDSNDRCDLLDLDDLLSSVGSENDRYDLNRSGGAIDRGDIEVWLTSAGNENLGRSYLLGDLDLDGRVDASDLNGLALNWQSKNASSYNEGDLNGDGKVNATDLNDLALNWHASATAIPVPEPACSRRLALIFGVLFAIRKRVNRVLTHVG